MRRVISSHRVSGSSCGRPSRAASNLGQPGALDSGTSGNPSESAIWHDVTINPRGSPRSRRALRDVHPCRAARLSGKPHAAATREPASQCVIPNRFRSTSLACSMSGNSFESSSAYGCPPARNRPRRPRSWVSPKRVQARDSRTNRPKLPPQRRWRCCAPTPMPGIGGAGRAACGNEARMLPPSTAPCSRPRYRMARRIVCTRDRPP